MQVSATLFIQLFLLATIASEPGTEQATGAGNSPSEQEDFEQDKRIMGDEKRRRRAERQGDSKQHKFKMLDILPLPMCLFKCFTCRQKRSKSKAALLKCNTFARDVTAAGAVFILPAAEGLDLLHCVRNKRTDSGLLNDFQQDAGLHVSHQTARVPWVPDNL